MGKEDRRGRRREGEGGWGGMVLGGGAKVRVEMTANSDARGRKKRVRPVVFREETPCERGEKCPVRRISGCSDFWLQPT